MHAHTPWLKLDCLCVTTVVIYFLQNDSASSSLVQSQDEDIEKLFVPLIQEGRPDLTWLLKQVYQIFYTEYGIVQQKEDWRVIFLWFMLNFIKLHK